MARTPDPAVRLLTRQALRAQPRSTVADLAKRVGASAPTIRKILAELGASEVLSAGGAKRLRYALRRPLRGSLDDLPLFAIDAQGRGHELSKLTLVEPQGALLPLDGSAWPTPPQARDGWWDGLPYPLIAMRPQGYLGRRFARAEHRNLGVSDDPDQWSDDDVLWVLSRSGSDAPGNLVLGVAAYERWMLDQVQPVRATGGAALAQDYMERAANAVAMTGGGSSAAGEFPKFVAMRQLDRAATPHVLVKFSGAGGSAAEQRWADLLVCEHIALEHARLLPGLTAPPSRILRHGGRTFLEVERFDRVGEHGRLAVCTLDAIESEFLGASTSDWPELAGRLHAAGLLQSEDVDGVARLWWFGRLIGNTDMHLGNLSFHASGSFRPAPVYDMLPMMYAPLAGGEVPDRRFVPALPLPQQRSHWMAACQAALRFWEASANDARIDESFRSLCRGNAVRLQEIAERV